MKNIAIFASGSGTNAENIAKTFASGNRIRVAVVVTDHENAGVVQRMKALDIPVLYFPGKVWRDEPTKIVEALKPYHIDLVVLAGFMRKVADPLIEAYPERMLNIHPSLLPAYGGKGMYGHHVHEAVIAAGEKQSGVTVHKVNSELDGGEIVMQGILELVPGETPETLEAKIHEIEYQIYPRAIAKVFRDLDLKENQDQSTPPAIPKEPTPDEQWANALYMPYTPPKEEVETPPVVDEEEVEKATPPAVEPMPATPDKKVLPTTPPRPQSVNEPLPAPPIIKPTEEKGVEKPANPYLVLSIIFLIVFGIFPAVVALIYSAKTRRLNEIGDFAGAQKASNITQGWLIASFCVGVLFISFFFPLGFFAAFS